MAAALRRAMAQRLSRAGAATPAYGLRRFLQEQPAFRPAVPPDRRFMPLADRIRDLGVAFPRINLDGLVPPAPPAPAMREEEPRAAVSLTVEEARKVLRATQMEAARARLRASGAGTVPYAEFLRLCCDAAGPDAGPSVARALDESGSVIALGKTVFLRPEMVKQ
ncbi:hypothetical protein GUJ93_ZPchr0012g20560 [Zizania palustris]|uniref:Calcium uniporter protein n=1 Tax=Zizania palustris TaxID=103762 RepID=A0A8J5WJ24_ZIZPA|nr:hypothetical protein GUJ93_ZPchr0012g20560 [Zizania palustris]